MRVRGARIGRVTPELLSNRQHPCVHGSREDAIPCVMAAQISADELKELLHLEPHPREGGWFRETWKAQEILPGDALPVRYSAGQTGGRAAGTAIYYLLEPNSFSEMHRLRSDEVFHFYLGDPVEMLQLYPDGSGRRVILGRT